MLARKDVDVVTIGTPDHWHCLQMAHACDAGKDVYVEKPLANSIDECGRMIAAAERNHTVVQVGQWQRSGAHWQEAMDFVIRANSARYARSKPGLTWIGLKAFRSGRMAQTQTVWTMTCGLVPHRSGLSTRIAFISIFAGFGTTLAGS